MSGAVAVNPLSVVAKAGSGLLHSGIGQSNSKSKTLSIAKNASVKLQSNAQTAVSETAHNVAALAKKVADSLPRSFPVVLQVGIASSPGSSDGKVVLQLVDRVTHEVYFRLPPSQTSPVVARLIKNGLGVGVFVDSQV